MELFAQSGYAATSVGAIERAAGLAPRSGALYQYFTGKDEVLAAALKRKMRTLDELGSMLEMLPLGDLKAELRLIARWNLKSLKEREALTRFVLRDAQHVPARLRRELYERLIDRPYAQAVAWVEHQSGQPPPASATSTLSRSSSSSRWPPTARCVRPLAVSPTASTTIASPRRG